MKKFIALLPVLIMGCTSQPTPSTTYNILDPFQAATDYLIGTRHYDVSQRKVELNFRENLLWQKTNTATSYSGKGWDQLFVKLENTASESEIERRYKLDDSLNRSCWALRGDAELSVQSQGNRGAVKPNYINACVSDDLGVNYPLFAYSWTDDPVIGQYLTIIKPSSHYSDVDYLCKLRREGYHFDTHLYC